MTRLLFEPTGFSPGYASFQVALINALTAKVIRFGFPTESHNFGSVTSSIPLPIIRDIPLGTWIVTFEAHYRENTALGVTIRSGDAVLYQNIRQDARDVGNIDQLLADIPELIRTAGPSTIIELTETTPDFVEALPTPTVTSLGTINGIEIFADQTYTVNIFSQTTGELTSSGAILGEDLFHLHTAGFRIEFTDTPTPVELVSVQREVWLGGFNPDGSKLLKTVTVQTRDTSARIVKIEVTR